MKYTLTIKVDRDEFTDRVSSAFDYEFDGTTNSELPDFYPTHDFNVGLIVGSSGSGKTQLLIRRFGYKPQEISWETSKAIISHFENPDDAIKKLLGCGLGSIPTLCKPFHVLSNGEKYRATIARKLSDNMILDEFTSEVNRETAKSLCVCLRRFINDSGNKNVVISSCHKDIIGWLQPDWVFDCDSGEQFVNEEPRQSFTKVARIEIF